MEELHLPVLCQEVVANLDPKENETYLDLTAGYAGHASKILAVTRNYKGATLVDRDEFVWTITCSSLTAFMLEH